MTESNTPPENQKKKSAFSRFFSRKKAPKPEQAEENAIPVTQPHSEEQTEKPVTADLTANLSNQQATSSVSYTHLTLPTIYSV